MCIEEAVVEKSQQVRQDFARTRCKAGCRAAEWGMPSGLVLDSKQAGDSRTETRVHFAQAEGCLRSAEDVRLLIGKRQNKRCT